MIRPRPIPPDWAVDAGIPYPDVRESFVDYAERLGLESWQLLEDLTERTAPLANIRLATALKIRAPEIFQAYADERYRESHQCR